MDEYIMDKFLLKKTTNELIQMWNELIKYVTN